MEGMREASPMVAMSTDTDARWKPDDTRLYMNLISDFPLRPIRDDAELDRAIAVLNSLIDQPSLTDAECDYLEVLGGIVEAYEAQHVEIPDVSGVELLRYLIEANGLTQASLVPVFGSKSVISEVLGGKRELSKKQIRGLSQHFGLPADAFI
jgi:HTH-type transcriptional regulator / antitoxin HigA